MTRTIEHCKVIYHYGAPSQHDGVCDGVIIDGNLIEKCAKCYLHDADNSRKICPVCGKEFYSHFATAKYCSKECRDVVKKKASAKKEIPKKKTLDEVLADLAEYNRIHGTHLTYGKYQDMLFKEALKNANNRK